MVSRNGRNAVNALSPLAKTWLAPLPYAEPSEAYSKKFKALMGSSGEASSMGIDKILRILPGLRLCQLRAKQIQGSL
jgi:hypothetical protein